MRKLRIIRNIRLGIKSLLLHKMRALLTMLGVVFGVSSVIAMLSVGEGASRDALAQIRKLGSQNIMIRSIKPMAEENSKETRTRMIIYGLKRDDETRIRESFDTVERIVPVRVMRRQAQMGDRVCELRVVGTTADWFALVRRKVLAGRVLRMEDNREHMNVCVLTEHGVRQLLPANYVLGETVMLGNVPFSVVGVVQTEDGNTTVQIPDESIDAYVPIATALDRYGEMNVDSGAGSFNMELVELHQLLVEVGELDQVESTALGIESMLKRFHKNEDYQLSVPLSLLREAEATKRRFSIVLGSIAGISLLVGGIGIMNIMLATVTERTKEIGIRRAIGARRSQIVLQFLVETIVLSGCGGIVGTILGILIPWVITHFSGMPTVVTSGSVILALAISMSVGLVFGLYPAVRAARLDPIEALRHE